MAVKSKKAKLTPNQQAYNKEIRRINQFIRRNENRGFMWLESPIPERPKRITKKAIQRLKDITPTTLYGLAEYYDEGTNTVVSGAEGRKIARRRTTERRKAQQALSIILPSETKEVLNYVRNTINDFKPQAQSTLGQQVQISNYDYLSRAFDELIQSLGEKEAARYLQTNAEEIQNIFEKAMYTYNAGWMNSYLSRTLYLLMAVGAPDINTLKGAEELEYSDTGNDFEL